MIKIDIFYFFISLFMGFILVYLTSPKPKIIFKYPTLDNISNMKFIDENNVCYKYKPVEIKCDLSKNFS